MENSQPREMMDECFKELTPEEKIEKLGKEVGEAQERHSDNLRKLREIEKEKKQIQAMMVEKGIARLKKMADMDELELRALELAKIKERKTMKYSFFKGAPSLLINDERMSTGAKAVFWLLQARITDKEIKEYPKVEIAILTIAKSMGVSYKTAIKYLNELREFGWVEVERRGKQLTNRYILYGIKTHDFNIMVKMKEVDLKLMKDNELRKKLTPSLEK